MAKEIIKEKTIRELVNRVAATKCLEVGDADRIKYQDLIGHATLEENAELANDPALNETFYWIYGAAYGTTAAIKFYLNNSNKIAEMQCELEDYKAMTKKLEEDLKSAKERAEVQEHNALTLNSQLYEIKSEREKTIEELAAKEKEIIELKAKMYDLMTK